MTSFSDRILSMVTPSYWFNKQNSRSNRDATVRTTNNSFVIGSELYDACLEMNWIRAEQLSNEQPILCQYQEGDNLETPLYMALQMDPPVHIVAVLVQTWSEAVITKTRQGNLPIHIACRYYNDEKIGIIRTLLRTHPETAVRRTRWGTTPLMEKQPQILQNIVDDILQNRNIPLNEKNLDCINGTNILEEFSNRFLLIEELLRAAARHRINFHSKDNESISVAGDNDENNNNNNRYMKQLVHAAIALGSGGCPLLALFYIIQKYPEQISMFDDYGKLPLHIAVSGPDPFCYHTGNNWTIRHFTPKEYWSIKLCLHIYPDAALIQDPTEPNGRYPLHTALLNGHEWNDGVEELIKIAPQVLRIPDPITGLYPFQIILTTIQQEKLNAPPILSSSKSLHAMNTSFCLLRCDPAVLASFKSNNDILPSSTTYNNNDKTVCFCNYEKQCPNNNNESSQTTALLRGNMIFPIGLLGLSICVFVSWILPSQEL